MKQININELKLGDILYGDAISFSSESILPAGYIVDNNSIDIINTHCNRVIICTRQEEVDEVIEGSNILLSTNEIGALNYAKFTIQNLMNKKITKYFYNNVNLPMHTELKHHQVNVAVMTAIYVYLSKGMSLHKNKDLIHGALLHDVGKLYLPDVIIHTNQKFNKDERQIMKSHSSIGYETLESMGASKVICDIARDHHECSDGSGYPHGKLEDEIGYGAQLIHIIDVYEALCAERSYKLPKERKCARDIMLYESNKYNKKLLHKFFDIVPEYFPGDLIMYEDAYYRIIGYSKDRSPLLRKVVGSIDLIDIRDFDRDKIKPSWFNLSTEYL